MFTLPFSSTTNIPSPMLIDPPNILLPSTTPPTSASAITPYCVSFSPSLLMSYSNSPMTAFVVLKLSFVNTI